MVGGIVIETIDTGERIWINCKDRYYSNTCAIWVERTDAARSVSEGDGIWWQGRQAFWTPASKAFCDYALNRIGCSGIPRPELVTR